MNKVEKKENIEQLYALIEIPKGNNNKYEYDQKIKKLFVNRTTPLSFPCNYGFICDRGGNSITLSEDGDDIDVLYIGDPVVPNCIVPIKVIGALKMLDNNQRDDKLLVVNIKDSKWEHLQDLDEQQAFISPMLKEISLFFSNYKDWNRDKNSPRKIIIEGWVGKKEALQIIEEGLSLYQKNKE